MDRRDARSGVRLASTAKPSPPTSPAAKAGLDDTLEHLAEKAPVTFIGRVRTPNSRGLVLEMLKPRNHRLAGFTCTSRHTAPARSGSRRHSRSLASGP
jgi:hypothetical protein